MDPLEEAHDAAEAKKAASRAAYETSSSKSGSQVSLGNLPTVTIPSMDYQATGKLFQ